jgi:hypothetical protein
MCFNGLKYFLYFCFSGRSHLVGPWTQGKQVNWFWTVRKTRQSTSSIVNGLPSHPSPSVNKALHFSINTSVQNSISLYILYSCANPKNTHKVENLFPHFSRVLGSTSSESRQTIPCSHARYWVSAHRLCYELFSANVCEMS